MQKAAAVISLLAAGSATFAVAQNEDFNKGPIKHVLLVSVDGMHAVDLKNCVNGISTVNNGEPYCPALLGKTTPSSGLLTLNANTKRTRSCA